MKKIILYISILVIGSYAANQTDHQATIETRKLFNSLLVLTRNDHKIMFGHQQDTMLGAYGGHKPYWLGGQIHDGGVQGWIFQPNQVDHNSPDELSDVKSATGQYPAVIGFDLSSQKPDDQKRNAYLIKKAADKGLIITLAWHMENPVSDGSPWIDKDHTGIDISHCIRKLLPNGSVHNKYKGILDKAANFIKGLKNSKGNIIPVIFRPFHEMNGGWFWWGTNKKTMNSQDDFKQLYQFTVKYLRDVNHVHNILYAWSPDKPFNTADEYLKFYPGDDYVDLFGLDYYFTKPFTPAISDFQHKMQIVTDIANSKNKLAALTEVGIFNNGINDHHNFWYDHVLAPLKSGHGTARLCYIHAWLNICHNNACELWVPYKGHPAAADFVNHFYKDPVTIFGSINHHQTEEIIG